MAAKKLPSPKAPLNGPAACPSIFKIVFSSARNAQATKDALITEVQKKIEADLMLNSLGGIIDAGNELPAPTADSNPIHRTTLRYTVEYKRKIADPPSSHEQSQIKFKRVFPGRRPRKP